MRYLKTLFFFVFIASAFQVESWIELEEMAQDFVLKTKRLKIEKYPDAFNPSIIRWKGKLLLSFRMRDPLTNHANMVGLVWLDKNFNLEGESQVLTINHFFPAGSYVQDPRMVTIQGRLYFVYSNLWKLPNKEIRRMFIAEVHHDGENFIAQKPEVFLDFEGDQEERKFEKNWAPFVYNDQLLLSYSINPHKVFQPIFGTNKCETIAWSEMYSDWNWGELRGGTQALRIDNQYLAFFHSSKTMRTENSNGVAMPHYFMGAYTFDGEPPFNLTKISPTIIVGKNFYNGKEYKTWKPLRVVFPCGFVFNKNSIWVSYGRQDNEMWLVKLDREKFLNSLIKVKEK